MPLYLADCQPPKAECYCECPLLYAGGAASDVDTHFPQHQLVDDPEGFNKNRTSPTYLGGQAYGGVEVWWNAYWRFGAELGYKNLAHFKTSYLASKRDSFSDRVRPNPFLFLNAKTAKPSEDNAKILYYLQSTKLAAPVID